jgi:hypothetical protein
MPHRFSDGKVGKRLVEYEWDEFGQVSVADRSRGVRVDVDEWPILGPDGILWSTSSPCARIEPQKQNNCSRDHKHGGGETPQL